MINRIRKMQTFNTQVRAMSIETYIHWLKHGHMFFDADYQRPYVWGHEQQQQFLMTAMTGFPLGHIAIAKKPDWELTDGPFIEVVDGKQRITTLSMFINNQIPVVLEAGPVFWKDFSRPEQLSFCHILMPAIELDNADRTALLDYFIAVNFMGVPQSEEHKQHILKLRKEI